MAQCNCGFGDLSECAFCQHGPRKRPEQKKSKPRRKKKPQLGLQKDPQERLVSEYADRKRCLTCDGIIEPGRRCQHERDKFFVQQVGEIGSWLERHDDGSKAVAQAVTSAVARASLQAGYRDAMPVGIGPDASSFRADVLGAFTADSGSLSSGQPPVFKKGGEDTPF